jgi:hypothetical protein
MAKIIGSFAIFKIISGDTAPAAESPTKTSAPHRACDNVLASVSEAKISLYLSFAA